MSKKANALRRREKRLDTPKIAREPLSKQEDRPDIGR
jgi:hypothetical protein